MRHIRLASVFAVLFTLVACGGGDDPQDTDGDNTDSDTDVTLPKPAQTMVTIATNMGSFEIQLYDEEAPVTTENFLFYVDSGFYDGSDGIGPTIFHRVVDDFVIQGGGETEGGLQKDTELPIENESKKKRSNLTGTVAMARTSDPDSATSQFYVNLADNTFLDGGSTDGYAVFGEVVSGMDVVEDIGRVAVDMEMPLDPVIMEAVTRN